MCSRSTPLLSMDNGSLVIKESSLVSFDLSQVQVASHVFGGGGAGVLLLMLLLFLHLSSSYHLLGWGWVG